jgi:hypothetical protein
MAVEALVTSHSSLEGSGGYSLDDVQPTDHTPPPIQFGISFLFYRTARPLAG